MTLILQLIIFWVLYFTGLYIGYIVPEKLVRPFGLLDFYPFECRRCCTFWSLSALYTTMLSFFFNWVILTMAVIVTFGTAIGMWKTQKERTIDIDELEHEG